MFVQDSVSFPIYRGTVRGLHFQIPPSAQAKLVRVPVDSVPDVAVDLRLSSTIYGQHVTIEIDAKLGRMVYVPSGFAHGFCALEPNTLASYEVTSPLDSMCDRSLVWNDPALGINGLSLAPMAFYLKDPAAAKRTSETECPGRAR